MHNFARKKTIQSRLGLTMIELMIAMIVMVLLTALIWDIFSRQEKLTIQEQAVLEMQDNLRVAEKRLSFLFSHAGYGCVDSFAAGRTLEGNEFGGSAVSVDSAFWDLNNQNSTTANLQPDSVVVSLGFRKVAEVNGDVSQNTSVTLKNIEPSPALSTGTDFKRYVCFTPLTSSTGFSELTSAVNPIQLNRSVSVTDDSDVYMVAPVRIELGGAQNSTLLIKNFAYADDPVIQEAAENIEDLQIQYSLDGTTWEDEIGAVDRNRIKGVRFFLLARSSKPDREYVNKNQYTYADRTVGPFNDNFRRLLLQRTVWVRNAI